MAMPAMPGVTAATAAIPPAANAAAIITEAAPKVIAASEEMRSISKDLLAIWVKAYPIHESSYGQLYEILDSTHGRNHDN